LDDDQINRFCTLVPIISATPPRLFVLMPSLVDWERLTGGSVTKEQLEPPKLHPYERVFVPGGVEFHDADQNGRFAAALRGEHPSPEECFASHEEKLAYKLECRLAQFLADALGSIVPAGSLGGGMSITQNTNTNRRYDQGKEEITITGVVQISVKRSHDDSLKM
jgi:hypothetical protein